MEVLPCEYDKAKGDTLMLVGAERTNDVADNEKGIKDKDARERCGMEVFEFENQAGHILPSYPYT